MLFPVGAQLEHIIEEDEEEISILVFCLYLMFFIKKEVMSQFDHIC